MVSALVFWVSLGMGVYLVLAGLTAYLLITRVKK